MTSSIWRRNASGTCSTGFRACVVFPQKSKNRHESLCYRSMRCAWVFLVASLCSAQDSRYERLMRDILIFDAHIDTPRLFLDEGYKLADRHPYYELDLP